MSVGTDTYIDTLLAEYLPPSAAARGIIGEVFESERNALLYAILVELRGTDEHVTDDSEAEADYYAELDVEVTAGDEKSVDWGFAANTVLILGFDQDVIFSFKGPNKGNREVRLTATENPASLPMQTSEVWYRQPDGGTDTTFSLIAIG